MAMEKISADPAAIVNEPASPRLSSGVLGAADITFMVVAVAAPMAVVVGTMPLAFALGNGDGVAGTYLLVAGAMTLLAIGYVRLLPHITNAGAFYAIVAAAFGRPTGLASAYVAFLSYVALCCATLGALSFFANDLCVRLTGFDPGWGAFAAATLALLAVLSFYRITLTAKVLGVALVAEVVVILMLDFAILLHSGGRLPIAPFLPQKIFGPGLGIAAIYAFNSCLGFEGTAIYQEEARDRERSIPRATYAFLAIVAVFYVLTAWCLTAAAGPGGVGPLAGRDPGHYVFWVAETKLGRVGADALSILVITSAFAAVLGLFNNSARYVFALARDGVLPRRLAATHPRHGSPFAAGLSVLIVVAVTTAAFLAARLDPLLSLATSLTGVGSVGLMSLLALTGFAIPVFLSRHDPRHLQAGLISALGGLLIGLATVLSLVNYPALTGTRALVVNMLPLCLPVAMVVGFYQAFWIRRNRPHLYRRIASSRVEE